MSSSRNSLHRQTGTGILVAIGLLVLVGGTIWYRYSQVSSHKRPVYFAEQNSANSQENQSRPSGLNRPSSLPVAQSEAPPRLLDAESMESQAPPWAPSDSSSSEQFVQQQAELIPAEQPPESSYPVAPVSFETAPPAQSQPPAPAHQIMSVSANENDSFWFISERVYNTGVYYRALFQHNRQNVPGPDRIVAGTRIFTPPAAELARLYPSLCPSGEIRTKTSVAASNNSESVAMRTYVIRKGDTLADIARNELGMATRWPEIYRLNSDRLPGDIEHLPVGRLIKLPQ